MSFWSSEKLKNRCYYEKLVMPYSASRVKHAAYELSLGNEYFSTEDGNRTKKRIHYTEQISIPPGQFALLLTNEKISIPDDAIGLISIKASIKFQGLVNVSGFHVDPGYSGKLLFAVYNAGSQPIPLTREEPIFLLWFSELTEKTEDVYNGNSNGSGITDKHVAAIQGNVASPSELYNRLLAAEDKIKYIIGIGSTTILILITLFAGILASVIDKTP